MANTKTEKIKQEIINSLHVVDDLVVYHMRDEELRNDICRELRKIHKRIDKLTEK